MSVTYGGDKITFDDGSSIASGYTLFRNRIINGAMDIDQRNAGAAVSNPGDSTVYLLDRWNQRERSSAELTFQQISDAPAGFINSTRVTVTTADSSIANDDYSVFRQFIEGTNVADLAWGTANAKTITLSFWVKSSVIGTFGGRIANNGVDRNYVYSYTINSANTWEFKTITIPGDTTGTWTTSSSTIGIRVDWALTAGSSLSGTADVWNTSNVFSVTGNTPFISTLNATWQITGVQLEVGSFATTFERRPYGLELALCQRYYEICRTSIRAPRDAENVYGIGIPFKVTKRATPTMVQISLGDVVLYTTFNGFLATNTEGSAVQFNQTATYGYTYGYTASASAEL